MDAIWRYGFHRSHFRNTETAATQPGCPSIAPSRGSFILVVALTMDEVGMLS